MQVQNVLKNDNTYRDTTQASTGPWLKRNPVAEPTCIIDSDISPELHCHLSKRRRLTVSYASYSTYGRQKPCRKRGLSLFTRPSQPSSFEAASPPAHTPTLAALNSMTQKACILDLPNELLSQILISGASSDWLYCLDYELFRAFRDAHPHLRRFALIELMRLYPQILDCELTASGGSGPSTPTQENTHSPTWKYHLQEAVMNPISRSTWNLTRYDPIHPAYFFNAAVAGCPTTLYVKKIPLFADDVYFTLSLDNNLPHFPSRTTTQPRPSPQPILWSRLREISLNCQITDTVAGYILVQTRRTLEAAAFNLKGPGFCRTPVHHSFVTSTPTNGCICMDALHSLKIDASDSLEDLFNRMHLPSLQNLELVSYPKSGFFRSPNQIDNRPNMPILNPGLNIPWSNVKRLTLRNYENPSANFDDIVSQCTQVGQIELSGMRTSTSSSSCPSFVGSIKSY